MRLGQLALIVFLLVGPAEALGRPWNGVTPGTSTGADIEQRFGEPTKRTKAGTGSVLAYFGEGMRNVEGVTQVQFHVDAGGVVQAITVFLSVPLDPESIEGTYGQPSQKTFTDSTFRKVWVFATHGVTAYWNKEGTAVEALSFERSRPGAPRAAGGKAEQPPAGRSETEAKPGAMKE